VYRHRQKGELGGRRAPLSRCRGQADLEDLIECWTLDEGELELVGSKTGATRRGFSLMLKFFELEARFPRREDVPKVAVDFVAGQVKVDPALFATYDFTCWCSVVLRLVAEFDDVRERPGAHQLQRDVLIAHAQRLTRPE
jgi:hypothetical protein